MKKRKLRVSYTIEVEARSDAAALDMAMADVPDDAQYSAVNIIGCWAPGSTPAQPKVGEKTNGVGA